MPSSNARPPAQTGWPRWRLGAFYASYFAVIGILLPYWPLYLSHAGFDAISIGQAMAAMMLMRVVTPGLTAWVSDHHGASRAVILFCVVLAPLAFASVFLLPGPAAMICVMAVFGTAWSGLLPQIEANTLNHLGPMSHRYSLVRVWGSVGFIAAVLTGGWAIRGNDVTLVPWFIISLLLVTGMVAVVTPQAGRSDTESAAHIPLLSVLRRPQVIGFLAAAILLQASFGPYYVFFTVYLTELDYTSGAAGVFWAWAVIAEIGVFVVAPRLLARFDAYGLLMFAFVATVVRWLVTAGFPGSPLMLFFAQSLHLAGFGLFHAVAISLVHLYFPGRLQNRGQALYSSLGFGLGGALGSLGAGWAWERLGSQTTWLLAAALAAIAAGIVVVLMRTTARPRALVMES
ncbi:MAG: MFS transporter [Gammaproteobacteria bacterium]